MLFPGLCPVPDCLLFPHLCPVPVYNSKVRVSFSSQHPVPVYVLLPGLFAKIPQPVSCFLALFPYWSVCYCQVCILFLCSISRSVRYSKVCVLFQGLYAIPICVLFPSLCAIPCPFQLSPFTTWVGGGKMTDDSAEILLQSFLQEATVSSSGMGQDVHSLTLSIQHFLCQPQHRPPSKVP